MFPYWILFFLVACFALINVKLTASVAPNTKWSAAWWLMFFFLLLMIGFRDEVGGDWETYLDHIQIVSGESLSDALQTTDPAYALLNWIGAQWGGIYFVNLVCAGIFSWGLIEFCRAQPFPWVALVSSIPYLVIVVAMGYTRQGVAIGLAMLALVALGRGSASRFVFWILCAALFHKSAVILAPLAILASAKRRFWMLLWVTAVVTSLFVLLLQESIDSLRYGYLEQEYQSSGAAIRIAMNVLPAFVFLLFRTRLSFSQAERGFWTWMSVGAILFVLLLYISPSSTAVDRVALYWIPIQIFVWSRFPILTSHHSVGIFSMVVYSALVQFVWLFFAQTAFAWLPYKFYPIEILFK